MRGLLEVFRRSIAYASKEENERQSLLFAFTGIIIGVMVSTVIILSLPVSMKSLEGVKELGIVSVTILDNYPKHQETVNYIVGIIATVFVAVLLWFICNIVVSKSSSIDSQKLTLTEKPNFKNLKEKETGNLWKFFDYALLPLIVIVLTLNRNYFFGWADIWCLFSEEGQHLAAVNSILRGQVLFKDVFYLYGPLMLYPLAGIMKLFGIGIVMLRAYSYILTLLSFFIFYFLLKRLLRNRLFVILFFFILMLFYFPIFHGPHGYSFRVIIGLSPFFLLCSYFYAKKRRYLFAAGAVAGISLFYSQEVGFAAIIAVISSLTIDTLNNHQGTTKLIKDLVIFIAGIVILAFPIIIYFAVNGAFNDFIVNLINYPRYVMMGYGGLAFPNILTSAKELIAETNAQHIRNFIRIATVWYSPILLYICAGTYLIIRFLTSSWNHRDSIILGILTFAGLLFRSVLGRPYAGKSLFVIPPILILVSICCEEIYYKVKGLSKKTGLEQTIYEIMLGSIIVFIIFGLVGFAIWPARGSIKKFINSNLSKISVHQQNLYNLRNMDVIGIERAKDIHAAKSWANVIRDVVSYIRLHTESADYIYVFPNEATYYFLTDRLNPSRFDLSFNAVTAQHRREIIRDLEVKKPQYIVYSTETERPDDISVFVQVPEIVEYIHNKYVPEKEFDGTFILKRKD